MRSQKQQRQQQDASQQTKPRLVVTYASQTGTAQEIAGDLRRYRDLGVRHMMVNILGGDVGDLYSAYRHVLARDPWLKVHLYGKQVRPGRKIGHVTVLGDDLSSVRARAARAARWLQEGE